MRNIEKWLGVEFESSTVKTSQFKKFASDFKKEIEKQSKLSGAKLHSFDLGHFYICGFIEKNGKYAYFSIPDVRYDQDEWYSHMLCRSAKDCKDYRGGMNMFCELDNLSSILDKILN